MLDECAALYSAHYGTWARDAPNNPGKRVRQTANGLKALLNSPASKIAYAKDDGCLVGYAIAIRTRLPRLGTITWVSQLVVHEDYRRRGVAKNLLFSLWSFSDHFAWGLVSANPFAVRALEKATRRRCHPIYIKRHASSLLAIGADHIPYLTSETATAIDNINCRIDTRFFLDHSRVEEMIDAVVDNGAPWVLGELKEGWEWFAFTFNEQEQIQLTTEEIEAMLDASDEVVRQAYSRMVVDSGHSWAKHAVAESRFIRENCGLRDGDTVLDFGCGIGRHSVELAKHGLQVTSVDYCENSLGRLRDDAQQNDVLGSINIQLADCRTASFDKHFACVVCLYDVIGSFANSSENFKIIRNIAKHLRPTGNALISVMNRTLTEHRATQRFSLKRSPSRLLELRPSATMESSGNIFNPDFYMIDSDTGIVYRKEQFERGTELPTQLIVRDRRYAPKEIADLLRAVGLEIEWVRCVQAGQWNVPRDPMDSRAKEILVLCRKPGESSRSPSTEDQALPDEAKSGPGAKADPLNQL